MAGEQRKQWWVAPPSFSCCGSSSGHGAQLVRTPRLRVAVRGRVGGEEGWKEGSIMLHLGTKVCILVTDNSQEPHSNIKTVIKPHCGYRHITWSVTTAMPMVVKKSLRSAVIRRFQIICPSHSFLLETEQRICLPEGGVGVGKLPPSI